MLKTKGALKINDGLVEQYEDKPENNLENFNAFWCSFAFRRRAFDSSMAFMEKSTLRQRVSVSEIENTPIYKSKGIEVKNYVDLGTWPEIQKVLKQND